MLFVWIFLASVAGACISIQAAANSSFRAHLHDVRWATFFSICGTILSAALVMLIIRPSFPSVTLLRSTPWWNWIGGPLGAVIVLSGAALTPKLGAAAFIAAIVAGQLTCSTILDHFALMNLPSHPFSVSRLLGVGFVFTGVLLISRN